MSLRPQEGMPCYPKVLATGYGRVLRERLGRAVAERLAAGDSLEQALQSALLAVLGLDIIHPDDRVRPGDRVACPGGVVEEVPGGSEAHARLVRRMSAALQMESYDEEVLIACVEERLMRLRDAVEVLGSEPEP